MNKSKKPIRVLAALMASATIMSGAVMTSLSVSAANTTDPSGNVSWSEKITNGKTELDSSSYHQLCDKIMQAIQKDSKKTAKLSLPANSTFVIDEFDASIQGTTRLQGNSPYILIRSDANSIGIKTNKKVYGPQFVLPTGAENSKSVFVVKYKDGTSKTVQVTAVKSESKYNSSSSSTWSYSENANPYFLGTKELIYKPDNSIFSKSNVTVRVGQMLMGTQGKNGISASFTQDKVISEVRVSNNNLVVTNTSMTYGTTTQRVVNQKGKRNDKLHYQELYFSGRKAGTSVVTIKYTDGTTKKIKVTIANPTTAVTLSKGQVFDISGKVSNVNKGDKINLPITSGDYKISSAKSSNSKTVRVVKNSGQYVLTAQNVGDADITVRYLNTKTNETTTKTFTLSVKDMAAIFALQYQLS